MILRLLDCPFWVYEGSINHDRKYRKAGKFPGADDVFPFYMLSMRWPWSYQF